MDVDEMIWRRKFEDKVKEGKEEYDGKILFHFNNYGRHDICNKRPTNHLIDTHL